MDTRLAARMTKGCALEGLATVATFVLWKAVVCPIVCERDAASALEREAELTALFSAMLLKHTTSDMQMAAMVNEAGLTPLPC